VLNANGTVHSEARHYPYGEERWSSGTLPTEYRFTGQRHDGYIKLTVMGARWYDGQLGRWISPDTIIPQPANPQSFNRYSYVMNRPLVAVDPSGHDLVIVGGREGDIDLVDMDDKWKMWIMEYMGWDEETWQSVMNYWHNEVQSGGMAAGNAFLNQYGIHLFTWGGKTIAETEHNAHHEDNEDMIGLLSNEMGDAGLQDITLLGWSKGGNLVQIYLKELAQGESLTKPKHAVLIAPANTVLSEGALWTISGSGTNVIPHIGGTNVANICAKGDRVCDLSVQGTINFNAGISGHGPHGRIAKQVYSALNVPGDHNALTGYQWQHRWR
jgi:RHS repeat-associated protein